MAVNFPVPKAKPAAPVAPAAAKIEKPAAAVSVKEAPAALASEKKTVETKEEQK